MQCKALTGEILSMSSFFFAEYLCKMIAYGQKIGN